jgi:hypothetical protein
VFNALLDETLRWPPKEGRSAWSAGDAALVEARDRCSTWLVRELALFRCKSSFHPSEPKEPFRMSDSEGALAAVVPVAAHIPGGGSASINLLVAVRILFETIDALVEVRSRVWVDGDSAAGLDALGLRMPSG